MTAYLLFERYNVREDDEKERLKWVRANECKVDNRTRLPERLLWLYVVILYEVSFGLLRKGLQFPQKIASPAATVRIRLFTTPLPSYFMVFIYSQPRNWCLSRKKRLLLITCVLVRLYSLFIVIFIHLVLFSITGCPWVLFRPLVLFDIVNPSLVVNALVLSGLILI